MGLNRSFCAATTCASLLALAAAVGGCSSLNDDLTLGNELVMSTLAPDSSLFDPTTLPQGVTTPSGPSVMGITRENWEPIVFLVPIDGTEHRAVTGFHSRFTSDAWQRVTFPTEETVLQDPTREHLALQSLEAVTAPLNSGMDILMAIPRMFVAHPWTVQESPREAYERGPRRVPLRPPVVENAPVVEPEAVPIPPAEIMPELPPQPEPGQ